MEFECPLLNKIIDDGYCYEINMVVGNLIKPSAIEDKIDKDKASKVCKNCEFNQMK